MATNLTTQLTLGGNVQLAGAAGLTTPQDTLVLGQGAWPAMTANLGFGAGNAQAKNAYYAQRTVNAGANDDLDLSGALANAVGDAAIAFSAIKLIVIQIDAPDGVKKLRIGPQGVANAFQGPEGGVVAGNYRELTDWSVYLYNPWAGYPVVGGASDILRINNPGAGPVTYRILIVGVTP